MPSKYKPHPRPAMPERFWLRVDRRGGGDACWPWTQGTRNGYGRFYVGNKKYLEAHRVAYALMNGPIPEGVDVLHSCDNPPCCNPAHLSLGTHTDNMRDMESKGRSNHPRGESHTEAKLTADQVRAIRYLHSTGLRLTTIAAQFGVTPTHAGNVAHRKNWRHLD